MIEHTLQQQILDRLSKGLPVCEHPYAEIADDYDIEETDLLAFIRDSLEQGIIKRLGMVVNHHKVGFIANAMVVWDVPDNEVDKIGELLGKQDKVTLCYQRPRRLPEWPYNLFTMIHGKQRSQVLNEIQQIIQHNNLQTYPKDILFSCKKFKQTGARYYG